MKKDTIKYYILVINPGSTSTKIAIFEDNSLIFEKNINHDRQTLAKFPSVMSQYDYRRNVIIDCLKDNNFSLEKLSCIVSRGGLTKPVDSGAYAINEAMLTDLKREILGEHASNLGPLIAHRLASDLKINSYVVDPVVVDELDDIARFTGIKDIKRSSIFHALNHKMSARYIAKEMNIDYEKANFVVAHLGGGISIGAHKLGKVIDVNNAFDGEGPFSVERAGTMPFGKIIDFCLKNHNLSKKEILKYFIGNAGFVSYFNTNNALEVYSLISKGDEYATQVVQAMAYNVAKSIVSNLIPLYGKCDAIILTGGLAYWKYFIDILKNYISWLNIPVKIVEGEHEIQSLAQNALGILKGTIKVKEYN